MLLHRAPARASSVFSSAAFVRQAATVRKTWLSDVYEWSRLCAPPPYWNRNSFFQPLVDADIPADVLAKRLRFQQAMACGRSCTISLDVSLDLSLLPPSSVFPFSSSSHLKANVLLEGWANSSGVYLSVLSFLI